MYTKCIGWYNTRQKKTFCNSLLNILYNGSAASFVHVEYLSIINYRDHSTPMLVQENYSQVHIFTLEQALLYFGLQQLHVFQQCKREMIQQGQSTLLPMLAEWDFSYGKSPVEFQFCKRLYNLQSGLE